MATPNHQQFTPADGNGPDGYFGPIGAAQESSSVA